MHYYQFNIGDYKSHTDHLDLLEDLAFRRMMDWCYLHECPLPLDINEIAKKILMRTHTESIAYVLSEFFVKSEDGYVNNRILKEVKSFKAKSDKARKSAEARWSKKETQSEGNANALKTQSEGNAKHKTLTNKQEQSNKRSMSSKLDCVHDIFNYWCSVMDKPVNTTKLTPKRRQKIQDRLAQGYTPEDIKQAIVGCRDDPFSMGQNDRGKKYNDIELICRSGEKLEHFMETLNATIQPQQSTAQKMAAEFERKYGAPPADIDFR
jgi:uncharacterized protein YdaU (DUF1376 family)/predicted secreted protein